MIWARNRNAPPPGSATRPSSRPHQPHRSAAPTLPLQRPRAVPAARGRPARGARHPPVHSPAGAPARAPVRAAASSLTACQARVGSRAARAASSRARSWSPTVRTSGAAARTCPRGDQWPGPAGLHELGGLHGAVPAAQQEGAPVLGGAQQQHLARVRLRGVRLAVAVVAVVPEGDQPPGPAPAPTWRRGSRRRPVRPLGAPRATARTASGSGVGGEHRVPSPRPAARSARRRRGRRPSRRAGRRARPRPEASVAATARPAPRSTADRAARSTARGVPPEARAAHERGPLLVPASRTPARAPAAGAAARVTSASPRARSAAGTASCSTSARLPAYWSATAREPQQLPAEHRLGRDDLGQRGEGARVVGLGGSRSTRKPSMSPRPRAVRPAPGAARPEPHPHPHAGLGVGVEPSGTA